MLIKESIQETLHKFENLYQINLILLFYNEKIHSHINMPDAEAVADCLSNYQSQTYENTVILLHTKGGKIDAAKRISDLMMEYLTSYSVIIPRMAQSSGTLIALSARQIIMSRRSYITPIDPNITSVNNSNSQPNTISSADIREFISMSENWFECNNKLEILKILVENIFPTSLSYFYRSEKQMMKICNKYLERSAIDSSESNINKIAYTLINGFGSHNYPINRNEAYQIGLNVGFATKSFERDMDKLYSDITSFIDSSDKKVANIIGSYTDLHFTYLHGESNFAFSMNAPNSVMLDGVTINDQV